eukprot:8738711-Pyramimonas_sp.AAC.1
MFYNLSAQSILRCPSLRDNAPRLHGASARASHRAVIADPHPRYGTQAKKPYAHWRVGMTDAFH